MVVDVVRVLSHHLKLDEVVLVCNRGDVDAENQVLGHREVYAEVQSNDESHRVAGPVAAVYVNLLVLEVSCLDVIDHLLSRVGIVAVDACYLELSEDSEVGGDPGGAVDVEVVVHTEVRDSAVRGHSEDGLLAVDVPYANLARDVAGVILNGGVNHRLLSFLVVLARLHVHIVRAAEGDCPVVGYEVLRLDASDVDDAVGIHTPRVEDIGRDVGADVVIAGPRHHLEGMRVTPDADGRAVLCGKQIVQTLGVVEELAPSEVQGYLPLSFFRSESTLTTLLRLCHCWHSHKDCQCNYA